MDSSIWYYVCGRWRVDLVYFEYLGDSGMWVVMGRICRSLFMVLCVRLVEVYLVVLVVGVDLLDLVDLVDSSIWGYVCG